MTPEVQETLEKLRDTERLLADEEDHARKRMVQFHDRLAQVERELEAVRKAIMAIMPLEPPCPEVCDG